MSDLLRTSGHLSGNYPITNNNLEELLKCVICYDKLIDPKMCPFCSKLCCKNCIHKWLLGNRSQCPHCRAGLRTDQLVTCRFLNEITQAIENLAVTKSDQCEKCIIHGCALNYYCMNCFSAVCSDCAMFGTEHKGHEFQHLANIYKQHVEQINNESKTLTRRLKELEGVLQDLDGNIEKFKKAKDDKSRELAECMKHIQERLDTQLQNKLHVLYRNRDDIYDEISKLKSLKTEVDKEMGQNGKSKLIAKSSELVKKLQSIQNLPQNKLENSFISCEFQSEIVPAYDSGIFILKDYSSVQSSTEVVYSNVLNANGLM